MKKLILITLISCLFGGALQANTPNQIKAMELMKQHYKQNKSAIDNRANQLLVAFNKKQSLLNPASCYSVDPVMCMQLAVLEPFIYKVFKNCAEFQKFVGLNDCWIEYQLCGINTFTYDQYKIFSAFELLQRNKDAYEKEYSLFKKLMNEDVPLLIIKKYSN